MKAILIMAGVFALGALGACSNPLADAASAATNEVVAQGTVTVPNTGVATNLIANTDVRVFNELSVAIRCVQNCTTGDLFAEATQPMPGGVQQDLGSFQVEPDFTHAFNAFEVNSTSNAGGRSILEFDAPIDSLTLAATAIQGAPSPTVAYKVLGRR